MWKELQTIYLFNIQNFLTRIIISDIVIEILGLINFKYNLSHAYSSHVLAVFITKLNQEWTSIPNPILDTQ